MKAFRHFLAFPVVLLTAGHALAQAWTQSSASTTNPWSAVAVSANGTKLAAAGVGLWLSANSGATWNKALTTDMYKWSAIASSADGTKLVAADNVDGYIYTSADSGFTWIRRTVPNWGWGSVASSADGTKLAAAAPGGYIYTSADAGATWVSNRIAEDFGVWVASSANGTRLAAAANEGIIFTSTDSGATWQLAPVSPNQFLCSVACSADGSTLAAGGSPCLFISTDAGATWTTNNVAGVSHENWQTIALSADGTKLAAVAGSTVVSAYGEGYIYVSTNSGITWSQTDAPFKGWWSVASSADGTKLVAAAQPGRLMSPPGGIYTAQITSAPVINQRFDGNRIRISWTIPAKNFALQQSADLSSWTDLTVTPSVNLTNLQNEVVLLPTNGSGLYRLKTQ
jgi:photosystem II stability/assembly factor-like uncharacterized protein